MKNENIFYYDSKRNTYDNRAAAIASSDTCFFYYHDLEFSKVDWKKSPYEPLSLLYKERAQWIRDNYEYVILCYSGGSDSSMILETFYYNNIHIDEILMVGAFSQDSHVGSDENHNGDLYVNAFPLIKSLSFPKTLITVKDYSEYFTDPNNFTLIQKYGDEWMRNIGAFTSVHNLFWYDLKKFVGRNSNKKTAVIYGADKPRFNVELTGKSYTDFNDLCVTDYGSNYYDENFERVNFFTDPKAEKIMRKQLHNVKNFYDETVSKNKLSKEFFFTNYNKLVIRLIYDFKTPLTFTSSKSSITCFSLRDMFMKNKTDSDMFRIYRQGLKKIKFDNNILVSGKESFCSQRYYLE
jgi:hypothetical protein